MKEKCFRKKSVAAATVECTEKRPWFRKFCILLPAFITAMVFLAACSKKTEAELSVESFYGQGGFGYEGISWGSNVEKVEGLLECSFDEQTEKVEANNKEITGIYKNPRQVSMYGYEGSECFIFTHHGLSDARIIFEMPDKDSYLDTLAETMIKGLQNAYGREKELSPSQKFYTSDGKFGRINYYLWKCEEKGKESSLIIGIVKGMEDKVNLVSVSLESGMAELLAPSA